MGWRSSRLDATTCPWRPRCAGSVGTCPRMSSPLVEEDVAANGTAGGEFDPATVPPFGLAEIAGRGSSTVAVLFSSGRGSSSSVAGFSVGRGSGSAATLFPINCDNSAAAASASSISAFGAAESSPINAKQGNAALNSHGRGCSMTKPAFWDLADCSSPNVSCVLPSTKL